MRTGAPWPRRKVKVPGERRGLVAPRRGRSYYTNLHNTMIAPLAPFPIRGAVWYQGEYSQDLNRAYMVFLQRLIAEWRRLFHDENLPVVVIQLHSRGSGATLREVQRLAPKVIDHTHVVTAADQGKGLHTSEKQEVGRRVAGVFLKEVYGKDVPAHGPAFREMKPAGDGAIRLVFDHADGLKTTNGAPPEGFEVGFAIDSRMKHFDARAEIDGETIIVHVPEVDDPRIGTDRPVGVRFGMRRHTEPVDVMTVVNEHGLPVMPFDSDEEWIRDQKPYEKSPR